MNPSAVVYVIAKAPRAGMTKTRLCPPLDPGQAAALAEAFLLDTIASVQSAGCEVRVMCREVREQTLLTQLVGRAATIDVQTGRGLGSALRTAFSRGLAGGAAHVAVLASDSPTLPFGVIQEAFSSLEGGADVALGPTEDGGYYLLAASALHACLFTDMPWSSDAVVSTTLARCAATGLRVHQLAVWYDVDDENSLRRLHAEFCEGSRAAPCTREVLARCYRERSMDALGMLSPAREART
jgi:rSAM/selenodomain-associated transferase 1